MGNIKSELDLLKQENSRLLARIAELEQIAKEKNELEVRIVELERSAKENIELKVEIAELKRAVKNIEKNQTVTNARDSSTSSESNFEDNIKEKKLRDRNLSSDNNSPCDIKTVSQGNDQIHMETRSSDSPTSQTELPNFPENEELYLEPVSEELIEVVSKEPDIPVHNENGKRFVIELAHLYQKARKAKKNTIYTKQEEILSWYYYAEGFEKRVDILSISRNNKRADDLARIQVYDEIWNCLSGVSRENFRKQTQRACKIYKLFNGIGKDKTKRVKSYSANGISKLTNPQIQYIIEYFSKNTEDALVSNKIIMECTPRTPGLALTWINRLTQMRKVLDQYPDIFYEFNDENIDYYGISDEAPCPLCKFDHYDEE
ncbi:17037_t:CDS:2, partial [Acaulospora colombiana]